MSKKYLVFLLPIALMMVVALMLQPGSAAASQLLGITITPTPETPPPTEVPPVETEPPPVETEPPTPTDTPEPPQETAKPKATQQQVLLPETGEFPIDPGQGLQLLFALSLFLLIGVVLYRAVKGSKPQN
jgi:hypothetical protein